MRFGLKSVAFRVIAFSTIWAVAAFFVIATVISTLYQNASQRNFDSLLSAHLFNLIGAVEVTPLGRLSGTPQLGDVRYTVPNSGWYWSVEQLSKEISGKLRSLSMVRDIASPPLSAVPFDIDFQRRYQAQGLDGEQIRVVESEFVLDAENRVARFRVMGNLSELEEEIWQFRRQLYIYLALFGLGMIAINALAILFGLRPLDRVRDALSRIREGQAEKLDGDLPVEIAPLATEMNALIENNRSMLERSRTQVGNLAHSLKTPLAVLVNEGRTISGEKGKLIVEQAAAMQLQVQHYLQRARIAAQRDSVVFRTPVIPLLERMVRVGQKLNPNLEISLNTPEEPIVFAGESEDFEEIIGNLLENAWNWAEGTVTVSADLATNAEQDRYFRVVIEDDGPGIPEEKAREVLKRGKRLDESKPGTGLGLSIVSDMISEYEGQLGLEKASGGGLKAVVLLRCAQ